MRFFFMEVVYAITYLADEYSYSNDYDPEQSPVKAMIKEERFSGEPAWSDAISTWVYFWQNV
jgi:hypothetical protein